MIAETTKLSESRARTDASYCRSAGVLAGWSGGVLAAPCYPSAPPHARFVSLPGNQAKLRYDNFIPHVTVKSRGRLPHWQVDDAVYFITFRLCDSLPPEIVRNLYLEREDALRASPKMDRARTDRAFGIRLDYYLDQGRGSCLLREHGETVANALRHFDRSRYELHAWCVMPNHVHVMVHISRGVDMPAIVQSWKSYTAHKIGRGVIWQREYFDRVVRNPTEFTETAAYIRANPFKAGLKDWPWVG